MPSGTRAGTEALPPRRSALENRTARAVAGLAIWLAALLQSAPMARAQFASPSASPPRMPLAVDLHRVPVGSWAEYQSGDGKTTVSLRFALVARTARSADLETEIVTEPTAPSGKIVFRMTVPLNGSSILKPTAQAIQIGSNDPMLLPDAAVGGPAQVLRQPDPKEVVGFEDLSVAAGKFQRLPHYKEAKSSESALEYWTSTAVPPFGLVKLTSISRPGQPPISMELVRQGGGAKPLIQKRPLPFDALAMRKQVAAAFVHEVRGGGKASSPP